MDTLNKTAEHELLARVAAGEQNAFTTLVSDYADLLHSFLLRHTGQAAFTEELVQDIFTQIWQTRETLTTIRHFRSFLFVIARNYAFDELKKQARRHRRHQRWEAENMRTVEEDDEVYSRRLSVINRAIDQLPPQQLKVWNMSRRQHLTYAAIASEMGISRETVKTYLQHANATIIKYVQQHGGMTALLILLREL